MQVICSCFDLF